MKKGQTVLVIVFAVLGVLSIFYSLFIKAGASGTRFYLVWTAIGACLLGTAWMAYKGTFRKLPKGLRTGALVVIGLAAAVFIVVECIIASHFNDRSDEPLDCLIVLGAQMRESGPSRVLKYRLDAAAAYLKEHPETKCIVSGGQGYNEPVTEAEGMRRYLTGLGIGEERIILEERSSNTVENIRNSMAFIRPETDRIGIVTNNFHVFRGTALAKKAGIRHVCGIAAGSTVSYLPNNMLREFLGVLKDFATGNLV